MGLDVEGTATAATCLLEDSCVIQATCPGCLEIYAMLPSDEVLSVPSLELKYISMASPTVDGKQGEE